MGKLVTTRLHLVVPRFHTNLQPIVDEFLEKGIEVFVYTFNQSGAEMRRTHTNLSFFSITQEGPTQLRIKKFYSQTLNLFKLIAITKSTERNNVFFLRCEFSLSGLTMIGVILGLRLQKKSVCFTQYPENTNKLHQLVWRWLLCKVVKAQYFTQVFVKPDEFKETFSKVSDFGRNLSHILENHACFIPLALPKIKFSLEPSGINPNKGNLIQIVSVAKADKRKGLEDLIKVFFEIQNSSDTRMRLVLVVQVLSLKHKRFFESLVKQINSYKSQCDVLFFTNISVEQTRMLISSSDIFVLNSLNEPASFSHLEAIALGIPVILNRDNGSSSVLPDDFGVRKVSQEHELKSAILHFADNLSQQKILVKILRNELTYWIGSRAVAQKWLKYVGINV